MCELPIPKSTNRKIAGRTRDDWGRLVRTIFSNLSVTRPDCKPSWLAPWEELSPLDQEVDRLIGELIVREVLEYCRANPADAGIQAKNCYFTPVSATSDDLKERLDDLEARFLLVKKRIHQSI